MTEYISRDEAVRQWCGLHCGCEPDECGHTLEKDGTEHCTVVDFLLELPAADVRSVPPGGIGDMSDGYHTFNGLYHQRLILFAALVRANRDRAWKSHRHEDGDLCFGGGWFIVGIDTPEGIYTYHYGDKDWDLFDCEELPTGKHWDGHTEDDVTRLLSLPQPPKEEEHER